MRILLGCFLAVVLIWNVCWSDPPFNTKYSYQAYPCHNVTFKGTPAKEFNNSTIVGSCFYQEASEEATMLSQVQKDIFPDGMTGVVFDKCNLDNVYVDTDKNTILPSCTYKKIKVQNDWEDWVIGNDLKPIEPTSKEAWLEANVSVDPKDIPSKKWTPEEREQFEEKFYNATIAVSP